MDIKGNLTEIPLSENAILHQSGVSFFRIFTAYRKEKKIRTEKIVSGVISRRAFLAKPPSELSPASPEPLHTLISVHGNDP